MCEKLKQRIVNEKQFVVSIFCVNQRSYGLFYDPARCVFRHKEVKKHLNIVFGKTTSTNEIKKRRNQRDFVDEQYFLKSACNFLS